MSQVVSKDKKEKMVDQSTKVIRTASQQQVRQSCDDEEDEDQDDYFDEEMEDEASPDNLVNLLRLWCIEHASHCLLCNLFIQAQALWKFIVYHV